LVLEEHSRTDAVIHFKGNPKNARLALLCPLQEFTKLMPEG
jgi:hypothetical protein